MKFTELPSRVDSAQVSLFGALDWQMEIYSAIGLFGALKN